MARAKVARRYAAQGASVTWESNIEQGLKDLQEATTGDALRKSCYAGAVYMYERLHEAVPRDTGLLKASLYHYFNERESRDWVKIYDVGPNKGEAPHWHLVEYGHELVNVGFYDRNGNFIASSRRRAVPKRVAPRPFIRPTYFSNVDRALSLMREEMQRQVEQKMRAYA